MFAFMQMLIELFWTAICSVLTQFSVLTGVVLGAVQAEMHRPLSQPPPPFLLVEKNRMFQAS